jgi:hypothetical protein
MMRCYLLVLVVMSYEITATLRDFAYVVLTRTAIVYGQGKWSQPSNHNIHLRNINSATVATVWSHGHFRILRTNFNTIIHVLFYDVSILFTCVTCTYYVIRTCQLPSIVYVFVLLVNWAPYQSWEGSARAERRRRGRDRADLPRSFCCLYHGAKSEAVLAKRSIYERAYKPKYILLLTQQDLPARWRRHIF